jgi:single-strand DNA-binding protein
MNKLLLVGRLTKETELKVTPNGAFTTSNTIAVNRNFKNNNGEYETDFINIVAWRNTAEFLCKYANKGSLVGLEGRLQTRNYQNNEGQKVYVTEMLVEQVELLGAKKEENTQNNQNIVQNVEEDPFAAFGEQVNIEDNFLD